MSFPKQLQAAIEQEAAKFSLQEMAKARKLLTDRYRQRDNPNTSFMRTAQERCAYLAARMPATYAACSFVLEELLQRCPESQIASFLDVGAGPGTASWAAGQYFIDLTDVTLVEQDMELIAVGKRLAASSTLPALQKATWKPCHFDAHTQLPACDVVMCSYCLGELPVEDFMPFAVACWQSTKKFFVVIEPGTPLGFERIFKLRSALMHMEGHMVAPCTHLNACPLQLKTPKKWCHFSQRIERSFLHAHIKEASLGFEDEKFSYLIFAKSFLNLPEARLLGKPCKHSGHISLDLCTPYGEEMRIVSKRTPDLYRQARKRCWGDAWPA